MSSPALSSGTTKPSDVFEDLWRQLGECHHNALQELEAKVSKLKKDRCLDAQRLEVFYNRNQQLKEQNKTLQDTISLLEERLRTGECDQCTLLKENLKINQEKNLNLIAKLKNERNRLEDENRQLQAELQKLKMSRSEAQEVSSPEHEEGIIPDSPVLPASFPVANRLKKHKSINKIKHVCYTERPLPHSNNSLFKELNKDPVGGIKNPDRAEVLVPNTCELDASQISNDVCEDVEEAVAETCGLDLLVKHHTKMEVARNQQCSSKLKKPFSFSPSSTLIHCPDSTTETSPSLLPRVKRFSQDGSMCKSKRRKEESEPEIRDYNEQGIQKDTVRQPEAIHQSSTSVSKKEQLDSKVWSAQKETSSQRPDISCISPAFKKPNMKYVQDVRKQRTPLHLNASHHQPKTEDKENKQTVEQMWSIDPALALSLYDSEWRTDEEDEKQLPGELVDTDITWVSHSLLQCQGVTDQDTEDSATGLGEKANDSMDMLFETTAYGEYKSYNSPHLGRSQPCDDDSDDYEEEEKEEEEHDAQEPPESPPRRKAGQPTFAHVAVIRKKDERRKLKGTTCKECEVYYAHLPEEEKQKKLSACSRHRFLYIPPSTPENFWEVGFPSTQTCIDRGYIREEKNPQARLRRRQPLNALFSLKQSEQES
ncbi:DNA endonuclease RBBP8 isoform X2 [Parambassis ranga]|nr:DNA endonuclease RBBP8 isoform X2 [Parambassis ranga]XP_028288522.1 DNA endonuclease RBBP8 isoform X2 [Parambassis ranga]